MPRPSNPDDPRKTEAADRPNPAPHTPAPRTPPGEYRNETEAFSDFAAYGAGRDGYQRDESYIKGNPPPQPHPRKPRR